MAEPFNRDGPVKVNETDFGIYKTIFKGKQPRIEDLLKFWLSESHLDGVRRLAIRDALRQSGCFRSNAYAYYKTDESLVRLCNILFNQNNTRLNSGLEFRPKLIKEIASELLYDCENDRFVERPKEQDSTNDLIGYIVRIADEYIGRSLIPHHSIWRAEPFHTVNTEFILRDIVDPTVPAWLRTELWENLQSRLRPEIATCKKTLQSISRKRTHEPAASIRDLSAHYKNPIATLLNTSNFINLHAVANEKEDFAPLVPIIDFLEENLPAELAYSQGHEMVKIALRLPDVDTAYSYARRHILSEQEKSLHFMPSDWRRLLYWLRGVAAYNHPEATDLITEIDRCLEKIDSPS